MVVNRDFGNIFKGKIKNQGGVNPTAILLNNPLEISERG